MRPRTVSAPRGRGPQGGAGGRGLFVLDVTSPNASDNKVLYEITGNDVGYIYGKPRYGRRSDGTLSGIRAHGLEPISQRVVPVRFDGSLTFSTVAYFEDIVIEAVGDFPETKAILVIGSGINEIDASGEERVREVAKQLRARDVELYFSGLKHQVVEVFERAGLVDALAATYLEQGGELAPVYEALVTADEAWIDLHGKYKSPHDFVVSTLRARYGISDTSTEKARYPSPSSTGNTPG